MFDFFTFKKSPVIEDVVVKEPSPLVTPVSEPMATDHSESAIAEGRSDVPVEALAAGAAEVAVPGQMDNASVSTAEDVIAAYKIFLGRLPESMDVVTPRVGISTAALLVDFLKSREFLDHPPRSQLVLALAKMVLDARKDAAQAAPAGSGPQEEGTAPAS